jgi:Gluconate 2-dehydrogenase subunit 3
MDRRTTIKWMLAASATWPLHTRIARADSTPARGYGTDPHINADYRPGEWWSLTLTSPQRRLAGILADIILPADEHSPSASAAGVVDFVDEWISAPYPVHQGDRAIVLGGFEWLDAEAARRLGKAFSDLGAPQQRGICDDICDASRASPARQPAVQFFALYRDLTAGGFYSSPVGRKDLNYIGNVPLASFEGPPLALLKSLGLV